MLKYLAQETKNKPDNKKPKANNKDPEHHLSFLHYEGSWKNCFVAFSSTWLSFICISLLHMLSVKLLMTSFSNPMDSFAFTLLEFCGTLGLESHLHI